MLQFSLKHPHHQKNIKALNALKDGGVSVPSLERMPELDPHGLIFWQAWTTLSPKRTINQHGPQPITVSEIKAYADLMQISDQDDREDLLYHIGRLDPIYLTHEYEERARAMKKARQRQRRGRTRA